MSFSEVLQDIQETIVANGVNNITADVLRPLLESMLIQPNELIGDLSQLDTADKTSLVNAINEALQLLEGDGAAADVRNLQARFVFNLENDVVVPNGESFDLTPNLVTSNTFNSLLTLDTVNRIIKTNNTEQLNLNIRLLLRLSGGQTESYDVALQRANEPTLIEQTKQQIFRRPDQGASIGGNSSATLASFSSGVTDPFNDVGFKITFFNPSGQNIKLIAGEITAEIFAVYNVGLQTIIANTIFVSQHNDFKFDSNYTVGTPTEPATGELVLNLENAIVGNAVFMHYNGATLPPFVTEWLDFTDLFFTANETFYISLFLHQLDGTNSVIKGVINK